MLEYLSQHDLGWRAAGQCQAVSTRLLAAGTRAAAEAVAVLLAYFACVVLFDHTAGPHDDEGHQRPVQQRQDAELAAAGDATVVQQFSHFLRAHVVAPLTSLLMMFSNALQIVADYAAGVLREQYQQVHNLLAAQQWFSFCSLHSSCRWHRLLF